MQGSDGTQSGLVEYRVTAAFLNPGGADLTAFIEQQQHQHLALQSLGDCFGRIKKPALIQFLQLPLNFCLPFLLACRALMNNFWLCGLSDVFG